MGGCHTRNCMSSDSELMRQYVKGGSEKAFSELVSHHLLLVHSAAVCRLGGDCDLAGGHDSSSHPNRELYRSFGSWALEPDGP